MTIIGRITGGSTLLVAGDCVRWGRKSYTGWRSYVLEMCRDVVAAANENWETAFRKLAAYRPEGTSRTFGSLTAISTGVQVPLFNPVFVFEPPAREDLVAAVQWMADREAPFQVTVADTALDGMDDLAADLGLEAASDPMSGMVLDTLDDIPDQGDAAAIAMLTDTDEMDAFADVTAAAFDMPLAVARQLSPSEVVADSEMEAFLTRVNGEAVGCGLLVTSGDVAGVYNIGVIEAYRRRGIGEALTWAVLRAGREAGCSLGVLQSSEMGYPVYERMGFETVVDYHRFHPA